MSVLETPRIYFAGETSWDPITTNNFRENYNESEGLTTVTHAASAKTTGTFRKQAIDQVLTGNWNPHGTHRSSFFRTAVSGFDLGAGWRTDDPFVHGPVELTGMVVDLEPYGTFSSQLFFDSMSFGVRGGYRISAPRGARLTARYINFGRNSHNTMKAGVASVVWQTSFAKQDGLVVDPHDSEVLAALAAALDADDVLGLTVRFNSYRTVYYDDPTLRNRSEPEKAAAAKLRGKLLGGGFQPNPARSLTVGVLGLWRRGEPMQEPGDRTLVPFAPADDKPSVGSAFARVEGNGLVLDLGNSIAEVDADCTKQDLGDLRVVAVDPDRLTSTVLGTIGYDRYDREAYQASAGIVTVPLDRLDPPARRHLDRHDIRLEQADGTVLLAEAPLRAVPVTPNLYLDEGDRAEAAFQVYERGVPAAAGVRVAVYQQSVRGDVLDRWVLHTGPDGWVSLTLPTEEGKIVSLVPVLPGGAAPTPGRGIDTQTDTFMYLRVRPADAGVAALPPTWENVYERVLANWHAMAPCMDNWLDLGSPIQVWALGATLRRLTDPAAFESFLFMPVTRDLSAGERTLLYRFLDGPDPTFTAVSTDDEPRPTFVELGRSLRE